MENDNQSTRTFDYMDEIDFQELFMALWNGKWLIVGISSVFAIASIYIALQIPNQYKAFVTLAPAQENNASLSGVLNSQLGGLASFAGVNLGQKEANASQIAIEIMQSWGFIEEFVQQNDLAVGLVAATGWDRATNELLINDSTYIVGEDKWVDEPTSWGLYKNFTNRLEIIQDKQTGMITVSINHYSPSIAKQWVELLVASINDHMRARKLNQANINIEYLKAQIGKTSIAEMQEVFYKIIEEQTKAKMLAEASPEYAFLTISKAMVPQEKSEPTRSRIVILVTLLGGILSVLLVLIIHYSKGGKLLPKLD